MKTISFLLLCLCVFISSCKKNNDLSGIFESERQTFYNGKAWNWVKLDVNGNPLQVAVVLNDAALNSVPIGGAATEFEVSSNFNVQSTKLPFIHATTGWNPNGHEPPFIYGKPHFDFHFYMMSQAARQAIPLYTADSLKFKNMPEAAYFPATYITTGGGVPQMGVHWVDITSPEFRQPNPQPFTQTFIYGSYNGKVTFYEPMITLDFIKATTSFERSIPQPSKYQVSGFYPTIMRLSRHDGITEIILDGFIEKQAS